MSVFYSLLGSHPELSLAEVAALGLQPLQINPHIAALTANTNIDFLSLGKKLGGTVKLLQEVHTGPEANLLQDLCTVITTETTNKSFSLCVLGIVDAPTPGAIKEVLIGQGRKTRYQEGSIPYGLAAAALRSGKVLELFAFKYNDEIVIAKTIWFQDVDDWSKRDRQRPYVQSAKGMLPLKVARMMVNLALTDQDNSAETVIYDPFCGTGSILMEAMMLGCGVTGSDQVTPAVAGTQANLEWLKTQYALPQTPHIFQSDATQHTPFHPRQVTAIVTEPFLGRQTPKEQHIPNIFKGLEKLYLGSFKNWRSVLKEGGRVVMVWPVVTTQHGAVTLDHLIDKLQALGYTATSASLLYARPDARVKRAIHQFIYHVTR